MSDSDKTLTWDRLRSLIGSQRLLPLDPYNEITVSLHDEFRMLQIANHSLYGPLARVYVDPTLHRGECYWGKPDPKRLGECFKRYLVFDEPLSEE